MAFWTPKPQNKRSRYWAISISRATARSLDLSNPSIEAIPSLKMGDPIDLNLHNGSFILIIEDNRRQPRGLTIKIGEVIDGDANWHPVPSRAIEHYIRLQCHSGEEWALFDRGSGEIAACLRWAKARAMGIVRHRTFASIESTISNLSSNFDGKIDWKPARKLWEFFAAFDS